MCSNQAVDGNPLFGKLMKHLESLLGPTGLEIIWFNCVAGKTTKIKMFLSFLTQDGRPGQVDCFTEAGRLLKKNRAIPDTNEALCKL
eukprot:7180667-Karenia_brevis.AAC.1